ncbi:MAG: hypothetical protein ACRDN9_02090 [Streptosporangiaceae bacterium]
MTPADPRVGPLTIPARFNGPTDSANGGYVAGRLASYVRRKGAVTVTLHRPPPLDTPLRVERRGRGARLLHDDTLVAEAAPDTLSGDPVDPVSFEVASAAAEAFPGYAANPAPHCFVCGQHRTDGLRLAPSPVGDGSDGIVACPLRSDDTLACEGTDGTVDDAVVWAALDCPGVWTFEHDRLVLLGRMTALVDQAPSAGERCVIMGRLLGREGRKAYTTTTLYDDDGRVLARAQATWIYPR